MIQEEENGGGKQILNNLVGGQGHVSPKGQKVDP